MRADKWVLDFSGCWWRGRLRARDAVRVEALLVARRTAMFAQLARSRSRVPKTGHAALAHLDPGQTLRRGFSIVRDANGPLVKDAELVDIGQILEIEFARARRVCRAGNSRRQRGTHARLPR